MQLVCFGQIVNNSGGSLFSDKKITTFAPGFQMSGDMNLVIDVGNTLAKVAVFKQQKIVHLATCPDLEVSTIRKLLGQFDGIKKCIVGSVRSLGEKVINDLAAIIPLTVLGPNTDLPVTHNYKTFDTLGVDRIAGVVAANHLFKGKNTLLIQTGTCVTYDFIDADGVYQGGGISPGLNMRLSALHTFTDKLPLIEPVKDPVLIGDSTATSILSGVVNGMKAELEGIMSRYESNYENLTIILSGGNLDYFDKNLKNNIFAVPNIVLTGLNIILEFNDKN
jgi:type III pantothenate kinase